MKEMTTITHPYQDLSSPTKLRIPDFDTHRKTIDNGNGVNRISITTFNIRCNL